MELKKYQKDALGNVSDFLTLCRDMPSEEAFARLQPDLTYRKPCEELNIPYVCVRIPTGGGKTLLAAHSVSRAAQDYLDTDYPVVLWLVPSDTVKTQTASALNNPRHAYRQALDSAFKREVVIVTVENFAQLKPQDFGGKTIVVVSTIANFRIDDRKKEMRKIYKHNEHLEAHFARLPESSLTILERITEDDLSEQGLQRSSIGRVKCSFANLLAAYRPLVIVDEAHNARTQLTFDTLSRLKPSAILEFTATPNTDAHFGSNIIYHVGAAALKAESMIKLPIYLQDHSFHSWEEIVDAAVLQRSDLARKAQSEPEYIRPVILFQAENKNGTVTVNVLRDYLINKLNIDDSKIAVVTGTQRELDNIDLLSPQCPIEIVITVEALKEGWDCPFAYVFCSLQNVSSAKDAEQLLGRVLRMPYAKKRIVEDLNCAYAHLLSYQFGMAAATLKDKLIDMGFNPLEIAKMLKSGENISDNSISGQDDLFGTVTSQPRFQPTSTFELTSLPDMGSLNKEQRDSIRMTILEDGSTLLQVSGPIDDKTSQLILGNIPNGKKRKAASDRIEIHNKQIELSKSPAEKGEIFPAIPQLCLKYQGELDLFEADVLTEVAGWNINDYPAEVCFHTEGDRFFQIDLDESSNKEVVYRSSQQSLASDDGFLEVEPDDLVRWLADKIDHAHTPIKQMLPFLKRVVDNLLSKPENTLADLIHHKFALSRAISGLIDSYRSKAIGECYRQTLFDDSSEWEACLDAEFCYKFNLESYIPMPPFYQGKYRFQKHFFDEIENLKPAGEEFDCAFYLDNLSEIKWWIRNPDIGKRGFWLPLSGSSGNKRFFPDFICELNDGRILVVEYKGKSLATNDDSKEKEVIGRYWADKSDGKCLFVMAVKEDGQGRSMQQQIQAVLKS